MRRLNQFKRHLQGWWPDLRFESYREGDTSRIRVAYPLPFALDPPEVRDALRRGLPSEEVARIRKRRRTFHTMDMDKTQALGGTVASFLGRFALDYPWPDEFREVADAIRKERQPELVRELNRICRREGIDYRVARNYPGEEPPSDIWRMWRPARLNLSFAFRPLWGYEYGSLSENHHRLHVCHVQEDGNLYPWCGSVSYPRNRDLSVRKIRHAGMDMCLACHRGRHDEEVVGFWYQGIEEEEE